MLFLPVPLVDPAVGLIHLSVNKLRISEMRMFILFILSGMCFPVSAKFLANKFSLAETIFVSEHFLKNT